MKTLERHTDRDKWQHDCANEMAMLHENDVFLKFVLLSAVLGFDKVAFGLEIPTSVAVPAFIFFANYAADWKNKFAARHSQYHGARVAHGRRTAPAVDGENAYYWSREDFYREAAAHDVTPRDIRRVSIAAGCIAYTALAPSAPDETVADRANTLIGLTHKSMARILLPKYLPQSRLALTPTEIKIMQWVLDGKTAGEISDIMAIGKSAIENHQRKLQQRFATKGIFATAFLAYRMGMLT